MHQQYITFLRCRRNLLGDFEWDSEHRAILLPLGKLHLRKGPLDLSI
jgi:hypothetical protein